MNAIIGMTAIGKTSADVDHAHYALGKIDDASTHLLGIINDILDMSKIESGELELSLMQFNFHKMFHRVFDIISFRVDEKGQEFSLFIDEAIPTVLIGDDQRLAQVMTNLLGNAVKFTPDGGTIGLNARLLGEEDDIFTVQIEVVDNGIGIKPDQQSQLFQPFKQVDSDTSRIYGGTGLGLSISKRLVEMMDGTIWVESEPERGTTFFFTVKMKRGSSQEYDPHNHDVSWKGIRVLVLAEDRHILTSMRDIVERYEAQCDTVSHGKGAMDRVRLCPYDIIFVDWKISDIDAMELVREVRKLHPEYESKIFIMLSSEEYYKIDKSAEETGVSGFLPKPLFPSAIVDVINGIHKADWDSLNKTVENMVVDYTGKCVLIAEDVDINREIIMTLLEPTKLDIECAENGAIAVSMFSVAPEKYDIIFMDVQMPEMDGYEATRQIRAMSAEGVSKASEVPIIAMTANVFREDIERCLEAGMNEHIGKPLDIDKVLELIKKYIG
jgi:CheY-like chemotaxis protein/two-component sensor histidine kinase